MNTASITPEEFLGVFFAPDETVCLRIFNDKPGSAFSGQKPEIAQGHFESVLDTLHRHNEQGRGIYFVINLRGYCSPAITYQRTTATAATDSIAA